MTAVQNMSPHMSPCMTATHTRSPHMKAIHMRGQGGQSAKGFVFTGTALCAGTPLLAAMFPAPRSTTTARGAMCTPCRMPSLRSSLLDMMLLTVMATWWWLNQAARILTPGMITRSGSAGAGLSEAGHAHCLSACCKVSVEPFATPLHPPRTCLTAGVHQRINSVPMPVCNNWPRPIVCAAICLFALPRWLRSSL